jgi:hypothetical protein
MSNVRLDVMGRVVDWKTVGISLKFGPAVSGAIEPTLQASLIRETHFSWAEDELHLLTPRRWNRFVLRDVTASLQCRPGPVVKHTFLAFAIFWTPLS